MHKHDLFFYPEGGRSYSGELKTMKTGLFSACIDAGVPGMQLVPVAVSYDLVLEDHVIAKQRVKRRQKAFSREIAEMVRYAVGYRSRAFVTFGRPVPLDGIDGESRKAVMDVTRQVRAEIGRLYKVLPTAVLAAAMTGSMSRADLADRIASMLDTLRAAGANLSVTSADEVLALATEPHGNAQHHRDRTRALPRPRAERAPLLRAVNRAPADAPRLHPLRLRT